MIEFQEHKRKTAILSEGSSDLPTMTAVALIGENDAPGELTLTCAYTNTAVTMSTHNARQLLQVLTEWYGEKR